MCHWCRKPCVMSGSQFCADQHAVPQVALLTSCVQTVPGVMVIDFSVGRQRAVLSIRTCCFAWASLLRDGRTDRPVVCHATETPLCLCGRRGRHDKRTQNQFKAQTLRRASGATHSHKNAQTEKYFVTKDGPLLRPTTPNHTPRSTGHSACE